MTLSLPFQSRFVEPILSGAKVQTIRRTPKRPVQPGDMLRAFYWTGKPYRSMQGHIGRYEITDILRVQIYENHADTRGMKEFENPAQYDTDMELQNFANVDGLSSYAELCQFLERYGPLPFVGCLIKWKGKS